MTAIVEPPVRITSRSAVERTLRSCLSDIRDDLQFGYGVPAIATVGSLGARLVTGAVLVGNDQNHVQGVIEVEKQDLGWRVANYVEDEGGQDVWLGPTESITELTRAHLRNTCQALRSKLLIHGARLVFPVIRDSVSGANAEATVLSHGDFQVIYSAVVATSDPASMEHLDPAFGSGTLPGQLIVGSLRPDTVALGKPLTAGSSVRVSRSEAAHAS